jgi:hypothetical protein
MIFEDLSGVFCGKINLSISLSEKYPLIRR